MKKKWMGIAVGTLVAASLTACGGGEDNAANEGGGGNENAAEGNEDTANEGSNNNGGETATYTVATDSSYVPFEFINEETGEVEGFDIDLINAIADEAGFEIEIEVVEFDGIVSGMGTGRYDIGIAGMTITEERAENFEFSNPYYSAGLILAVQEGEEEIQSIDDVDGLRVATRAATTSETYLQENTDAEVVTFPDIVNAYQDLQAGRVDAAIYDLPNVLYYIDTEGVGEMETAGDTLTGEQYGIAFPEDSEIREDVNEALATLMDDGTYGEIYQEWFGEEPDLDILADSPEDAMNLDAGDMDGSDEADEPEDDEVEADEEAESEENNTEESNEE
ncbi:transporter substrate-binding domain-containing protein [Alkalicoccus halolimnae]|uniref:Transporter substrate-binding domain-containing protein n=1 Tax=Alkalicoccus halolimnae TaxID=1667239 RepID=A0AAJ8LVV4_9BACI|nr:transporter substrate-binding domain-containing protein [Alkalicoccus halolimnae]